MDKFEDAFNNANEMEFCGGFKFDEPDYEALQVTEENYLDSLRIQAAGIAYYGTLAKNSERAYIDVEKHYKARYNEMYDVCQNTLERAGKRITEKTIDMLMRSKYEAELNTWDERLSEARSNRDGAAAYYEAWKAKGFALSSMTSLVTAGLITPRTTISEEDIDEGISRRMNASKANDILSNHKVKK